MKVVELHFKFNKKGIIFKISIAKKDKSKAQSFEDTRLQINLHTYLHNPLIKNSEIILSLPISFLERILIFRLLLNNNLISYSENKFTWN